MSAIDEQIDRLYSLPLDEFTRARDELARVARQEGDGARAAEVKQLRKPSLPAWVVNQLARQRELDMQRLVKAGERLASAQAEAIRAQSGDAFLEARRDQQHALEALAARAREILAEAGRGSAMVDRVLATLRAGSSTEDGRPLLKSGRLTEELEPPGFEALAGFDLPPAPLRPRPAKKAAPTPAVPKAPPPSPAASQPRRAQVTDARRRLRDLREDLQRSEKRAAAAERRAAQLREQLEAAEADAGRLDEERRRAEEELAAAERDLERLTEEE
ncbi:MAG TPA: hypothetical protein VF101_18765 [Gaiellaceae bacterium]